MGTGTLHTFAQEDVGYWGDRDMNDRDWRVVNNGEQLTSTIYEFCSAEPRVSLSRISQRHSHSVTETVERNLSADFGARLLTRDVPCVISSIEIATLLKASHLIPKRMGSHKTAAIIDRYV
jgi:hypothetical protein